MSDIPLEAVETIVYVKDPSGVAKEVGYVTGAEASLPNVIVDYTNPAYRAGVTSEGKLKVEAYIAQTGTAPLVIIRDSVNPLYQAQVDSQGRLAITMTASVRRTIELWYYNTSIANYVTNMWRSMQTYTVPTGYNLELLIFTSLCGSLAGSARAAFQRSVGAYNIGTEVFTDGYSFVAPGFASNIEAEVTTAVSGAVNLTVTYVNQDGVAGRTGTITIPGAASVGYRYVMALQAGDVGVRDVTAVTRSVSRTGVVDLLGTRQIFFERLNTQDQTFQQIASRESLIAEEGQQLSLDITGTNTTNTIRLVRVVGLLIPNS